jgi:hypothetical protein
MTNKTSSGSTPATHQQLLYQVQPQNPIMQMAASHASTLRAAAPPLPSATSPAALPTAEEEQTPLQSRSFFNEENVVIVGAAQPVAAASAVAVAPAPAPNQ